MGEPALHEARWQRRFQVETLASTFSAKDRQRDLFLPFSKEVRDLLRMRVRNLRCDRPMPLAKNARSGVPSRLVVPAKGGPAAPQNQ
jgi:hypothetical protein